MANQNKGDQGKSGKGDQGKSGKSGKGRANLKGKASKGDGAATCGNHPPVVVSEEPTAPLTEAQEKQKGLEAEMESRNIKRNCCQMEAP